MVDIIPEWRYCNKCKEEYLYVLESTGFVEWYITTLYCPKCKAVSLFNPETLEETTPHVTLYIELVDMNRKLLDKIHGKTPRTDDDNEDSGISDED
jgi:phage FluMu protein Com